MYSKMNYNRAMDKKIPTSIRLSQRAKELLKTLSDSMALSQTGVIEVAIRRLAADEGKYGAAPLPDVLSEKRE